MNTDRHSSPGPIQSPGAPADPSLEFIELQFRAPGRAAARYQAPLPSLPPSDVVNDAHDPKAPREVPADPVLGYGSTSFWLAVLYLATLIIPWVLICILEKRPLTSLSYYYQKGAKSAESFLVLAGVLVFINTLRAVSGVIVAPATSAILVHVIVVYSRGSIDSNYIIKDFKVVSNFIR